MIWKHVIPKVQSLLNFENPPSYLIIHCGGNDIGQDVKSVVVRNNIKKDLLKLHQLLPETVIVWSQVLPRVQWRGELDHFALERARERLNNCIATFILKLGGKYIRYPELKKANPQLFKDSVHLNFLGNSFFLHRIQQSMQHFISDPNISVTPRLDDCGPWLQYF